MTERKALLAIVGAGGHGMVVAETAELQGGWAHLQFFDDALSHDQAVGAWSVAGKISHLLQRLKSDPATLPIDVIVAIGHNATRAATMEILSQHGARFATVVHPRAYLSPSATLGAGSVALAGAVVNSRSTLGEGCIVNVGAVVDHDVSVGAFAHLASGSVVAGGCDIGRMAWLGTGSRIAPGKRVEPNAVLLAGTVIV
ncbi:MAG: NeuD/PglB/VioB family sugar acetyltransferase [Rubrivivax sp.]|jgi:sugar O-acyltransferase (sialic acid O-acetyltransferase NeuD family)